MSCLSASHRLAVPDSGANSETNGAETDASFRCHPSLSARARFNIHSFNAADLITYRTAFSIFASCLCEWHSVTEERAAGTSPTSTSQICSHDVVFNYIYTHTYTYIYMYTHIHIYIVYIRWVLFTGWLKRQRTQKRLRGLFLLTRLSVRSETRWIVFPLNGGVDSQHTFNICFALLNSLQNRCPTVVFFFFEGWTDYRPGW